MRIIKLFSKFLSIIYFKKSQNSYPLFDLIYYLCIMKEFIDYYNFFREEKFCFRVLKEIREQQGDICEKCKNETHYWKNDKNKFECSVSTSAKKEEIAQLDEIADNLIVSRSEKESFRLYMTIERLKAGHFEQNEIQIHVSADTLSNIKEMANHSQA